MLPRRAPADTQRSALVPSTKCVPPVLDRYLCSKAGQQPNLGTCEVSEDFTRHYGQTVYVCQGAAVNDLHGGICTLAAMRLEHDRQLHCAALPADACALVSLRLSVLLRSQLSRAFEAGQKHRMGTKMSNHLELLHVCSHRPNHLGRRGKRTAYLHAHERNIKFKT